MILILLLMALIVGVVQWRAVANERASVTSHPPIGQLLQVNGVTVHAHVSGAGPDVVLLHGASGNLRDLTFDLVPRLAARYRVIAFDRPGLGFTDRLPGTEGAWNTAYESPRAQARLLQAAADQLGVQNPVVVGHSFGSTVALAWALERPDDTGALALLGGVSEPWPGGLGWLYRVTSSALGGAIVVPLATAFYPQSAVESSIGAIFAPQTAPEGYTEYIGAGLTLRRASTRANAQQVNYLRPHVVEMQKHYDTLRLPIELIHGDADTIVPPHIHAQVFAAEVPSAHLVMLPGVGHMPHHADPQAAVDAIDRAAARAGLR